MATLETTIRQTHDWALGRIHLMADGYNIEDIENAHSITQEFSEWLDPDKGDHEIVSLEYIGDGGELQNLLGLD
jgi:hypothetical protein